MGEHDKHGIPADLRDIANRLEAERPRASDLELDRIKLKAMSGASPASSRRPVRLRSARLASVVLAGVLVVGGAGAVFAKKDPPPPPHSNSSSNSQYCPPSSPGAGKPKKPGPAKCGHP